MVPSGGRENLLLTVLSLVSLWGLLRNTKGTENTTVISKARVPHCAGEMNQPQGSDEFSTGIWYWNGTIVMDLIFFGEALHIFLCKRTKGLTCTLFS